MKHWHQVHSLSSLGCLPIVNGVPSPSRFIKTYAGLILQNALRLRGGIAVSDVSQKGVTLPAIPLALTVKSQPWPSSATMLLLQ